MTSSDGNGSTPADAQLLRTIFDTMPDAYLRAGTDGRIVLVNPSAVRLFGYSSAEEMIGQAVGLIYADEGAREFLLRQLRETGRVVNHVAAARRKDGSTFWASLNAQTYRDASGAMAGTEGYVRDVTENKEALEALRRSEARFQKAFHHSPDAINLNRMRDGLYVEVNRGFLELSGYERHEVIGRTSLELNIWTDPADRARLVHGLREAGEVVNLAARFRARDGSERTALMSAGMIELDGEPHILSVTRDISDLRRVEAEKAELESRLRHAEKMESVGRLAGGVAHDFNNMLGVILGHAELALQDTDARHSTYADLLAIQQAARRSADLTRQLLAFARKQTIARQVVDLNAVVQRALQMLRRMIGEGIDLRWNPSDAPLVVHVDPAQVDQVLINLCVNARDAMAGAGLMAIETEAGLLDESSDTLPHGLEAGGYAILRVRDNGTGMDEDTKARLFEPYFTTKELGKGTGLGLATVYGIVKQNGGLIDVESEIGRGTRFTIYLPRHDASGGNGEPLAVTPEPAEPRNRAEQETILLVEDEPAILALAARMLTARGYQVLSAATPGEATRLTREHARPIHLLITDVVMPEMNGRELGARLQVACPGLRCLFMSGYTADIIARHGVLDAGVHFVQKPFALADLAAKVRSVLDES